MSGAVLGAGNGPPYKLMGQIDVMTFECTGVTGNGFDLQEKKKHRHTQLSAQRMSASALPKEIDLSASRNPSV